MKKLLVTIMLLLLFPLTTFTKEKVGKPVNNKAVYPTQAIKSNYFAMQHVGFNKVLDPKGRGEVLKVTFELKNLIDAPLELYVFVIATYEISFERVSSFKSPKPVKEAIQYFVPYPDGIMNYDYPDNSSKNGSLNLKKFPKNPGAGVNPHTKKPYMLKDNLIVGSSHLNEYRKDYNFFNTVTILVFEENKTGKKKGTFDTVFKQIYRLNTSRK